MNQETKNQTTSRKIELVIRKINSLSTLPSILAELLGLVKENRALHDQIAKIVESDPALTANILCIANAGKSNKASSVYSAVENLSNEELRQAVMSTKVHRCLSEPLTDERTKRKELVKFSIAVACASKAVGYIILDDHLKDFTFTAGILHNLGKLAIEETMPKSYDKINEETQLLGESDLVIERKYLGIDNTIIGKRLADKWKLPDEISSSIWLCRSDIEAIITAVSSNHPAVAVALGYLIARDSQIGDSGSYEPILSPESFAYNLNITNEQISEIKKNLSEQVNERANLLRLEIEQPEKIYSQAVWELATNLAKDNSSLSEQNNELTSNLGIWDFANNFLPQVGATSTPLEVISSFGQHWQRYYQTGPVCMYLCRDQNQDLIDAVTFNHNGQINVELLSLPGQEQLIPDAIKNQFEVIDADEKLFKWVYDQIEVKINSQRAKAIPVISSGKTVAVLVWEYRYLPQNNEISKLLSGPVNILGPVIELSYAYENQQRIAEEFASLLGRLGSIKEKLSKTENLEGLAEMAAGAAHELNNPITIASGRLQMVINQETDESKSQSLKLVNEKIEDISKIVSDLMEFAVPKEPQPRMVSPAVLIDSAVDYVRQRFGITDIETNISNLEPLRDIYVDSQQVKEAIANVIRNAYESYHDTGKSVSISGAEQSETFVRLQISDEGCGMDSQTLIKARQPFFSGQPAGRKRGMGLAHTQRLLAVNNGSLHIASQPGKGTTVTILLPCGQK